MPSFEVSLIGLAASATGANHDERSIRLNRNIVINDVLYDILFNNVTFWLIRREDIYSKLAKKVEEVSYTKTLVK